MREMMILLLGLFLVGCGPNGEAGPNASQAQVDANSTSSIVHGVEDDGRPIVAIWRAHDGHRLDSQGPYLRVAIWADGRAVFAENPEDWASALREGTVPLGAHGCVQAMHSPRQASLTLTVTATLSWMPPVTASCVRLGGQERILYWDEVEHPRYGINVSPQERHYQFMDTWKNINSLTLASLPTGCSSAATASAVIQESWYIQRAIQSR